MKARTLTQTDKTRTETPSRLITFKGDLDSALFSVLSPIAVAFTTRIMYERAIESGANFYRMGFPESLASFDRFIPERAHFVVITGGQANITAVAEYGHKSKDPKTRGEYHFLIELAGSATLANKVGPEADSDREIFEDLLYKNLDRGLEINLEGFKTLMATWNLEYSFEEQISLHSMQTLCRSVLSLEHLEAWHMKVIRRMGKFIINPNIFSRAFQQLKVDLAAVTADLIEKNKIPIQSLEHPLRILSRCTGNETDAETFAKLANANHGFDLIAANNLATITTAALRHVHQNPDVLATLRREFPQDRVIDRNAISSSTLLYSIFLEAARFSSPSPVISRTVTDKSPQEITVKNDDGQEMVHPLKTGDKILFLMRKTHHDSRFFPTPEKFVTDRFKNMHDPAVVKMLDYYTGFSAGDRKCIAAIKYSPLMIMSTVVQSLNHDFAFSEPLSAVEVIKANRFDDDWQQDHFLQKAPELVRSAVAEPELRVASKKR